MYSRIVHTLIPAVKSLVGNEGRTEVTYRTTPMDDLNENPSLSLSAECGHRVQPLPVLPGGDGPVLWRFDGQDKGSCGEAGGGRARRALPAQAVSQAHERHRAAAQSHPGAGGHREVLREGQAATVAGSLLTRF